MLRYTGVRHGRAGLMILVTIRRSKQVKRRTRLAASLAQVELPRVFAGRMCGTRFNATIW
jgi:hypothetical protein